MFTSFDEKDFRQAIKEKDFLCLKVNTVSTMLNDPTFERGETMEILKILKEKVPEIFEDEIRLDYEERLERSAWDKRYFTKLTYWFQENFSESRVAYIKEVGSVVHKDTAKMYSKSLAMQNKATQCKEAQNVIQTMPLQKNTTEKIFPVTGAFLGMAALALAGILIVKFLFN